MNDKISRPVRAQAQPSSVSLNFAAGDFEFAHWLSNIGVGPKSLYAGAYTLKGEDGSRRLAYCLNFNSDFDTERSYTGSPVAREAFNCENRFGDGNDVARKKTQKAVTWIARNTFPAVPLEHLAEVTGTPDLTREEAIAATQTAIWTLTNDLLFAGLVEADFPATKRVLQVINYFLGSKNKGYTESKDASEQLMPGAIVRLQPVTGKRAHQTEYFVVLSGVDTAAAAATDEGDRHQQAVA